MKKAAQRKVRDIANRVKDLKTHYVSHIKNKDPEERLIPRVTALVIREGVWIVKAARTLLRKSAKAYKPTETERKIVADAEAFFGDLQNDHSEDIERNLFVYRMDPDFITHLDRVCLLVIKLDRLVSASIAAHAKSLEDVEDAEGQEEIDAEMTA